MSEALYALLKQKKNIIKANLAKDPSATTERAGLIRIATLAEAGKGVDNDVAITPYTLKEVGDIRYGASIGLDLDPETFQLTMSLINGNGETLSSETIDLPSENALTDVEYDNSIKSLIFTYESGDTKTVSIEHVIDGLQKEITPENMLSSDLVDDTNKQHKFVTPEERQKLDDTVATASEINQLHNSEVMTSDLTKLHNVTVSADDINQLSNIESNVQGQLNNKLELNSLSIKPDSTNYLGYDNTNGQISAKVDTTVTQNSTKLITSGGVQTAISNAQSAANTYADNAVAAHNTSSTAHADIREDISDIEALIPEQATTENQLADKEFVNSSIATNTANFIGTFSNVSDLRAYSGTVTNNDYAFVINSTVTDNGNDWATFAALDAYDKTLLTNFDYAWVINGSKFDLYRFDIVNQIWESRATNIDKDDVSLNSAYNRYKATIVSNITQWDYEYTLNNSSFTADQWTAINSNITPELTAQITTNKNNIETIQGDYVPKSRTVNGKALSSNITLNAGDVNALPASTTINDLTTQAQQDALNSGANTTKINQIVTNTTNIASNTSAISTINGKIPSNASTTNKMSTANDLSNAVENLANKQLDNLDRTGDDKLYALRGLYNNGELLTDAEGLADVENYAHSTFDLSKFTVVGSPTITDDGIASGCDSSNYIHKANIDLDNKTYKFKLRIKTPSDFSSQCCFTSFRTFKTIDGVTTNKNLRIYTDTLGRLWVTYYNSTSDVNIHFADALIASTWYDIEVEQTSNKLYLRYALVGQSLTEESTNSTTLINMSNNDILIGLRADSTSVNLRDGSIDLKQFSITVDGVEVFSGNKTGIDTISNYNKNTCTIIGSATIDNNGIASDFTHSTSSYIKTTFNPADYDNFELGIKFHLPASAPSETRSIFGGNENLIWSGQILFNSSRHILVNLSTTGSSFNVFDNTTGDLGEFTLDTDVWLKIIWTGSVYKVSYSTDGSTYTDAISANNTNKLRSNIWLLGNAISFYNGTRTFPSTIDVKEFYVKSNGVEVISGSGQIPYTESKTGSKIVQSIYLDRVKDAYEQGYLDYQYYTLQDEPKGNYQVVGSPTISSDFVASGFSGSNYLQTTYVSNATYDFEILIGFKINTLGNIYLLNSLLALYGNGRIVSNIGDGDKYGSYICTINTDYLAKIKLKNGYHSLNISTDNGATWTEVFNVENSNSYTFNILNIGCSVYATGAFTGSIDLKQFKIYVDNKLAYEAVIPPNFTLPMGELYGLINHNTQAILEDKSNISAIQEVIPDDATSSNKMATASDITGITNKIPTDATSSNKLVSASTLSASIADFANKDLANLSTIGNKKLRAIKGYEELGGVLEDTTGYSDVEALAHSTFDLSKFTVVSSPNITDDGIASGFSSSNYLRIPNLNISGATNFELTTGWFSLSDTSLNFIPIINWGGDADGETKFALFYRKTTGNIDLTIYQGATSIGGGSIPSTYVSLNKLFNVKIVYKNTKWNAYYKTIDSNWIQFVTDRQDDTGVIITTQRPIGWKNSAEYLTGSIDLKQFSITVDGVEVFSGNRTGIDTIKPDDYMVEGTPTITADGIVSGLTSSNFISKVFDETITQDSDFEIILGIKTGEISSAQMALANFTGGGLNANFLIEIIESALQLTWTDIDNAKQYSYCGYGTFQSNTEYIIKIKNENRILSIYINDVLKYTATKDFYGSLTGFYTYFASRNFNGSIDLNAIKWYVDGNLVYQPCLKIPYTEIKEGGKVADALYRDRVLDAFQQNYTSYSYYTIDETNQNYTLPTGNIYSLIESKRVSNPQNTVDIDAITQYSALETGSLSTNLTVYDQLVKRKHSTFDRSKFTVVGSPNITNDGIVSGFGSANDTKRIAIPFNYPTQNFKLKGCLTIGNGDGSIIGSWNVNPPFNLYVHGSDGKYAIPSIAFDVNGTRTVTKLTNAYYSGSAVFQIPDDFTQGKYYYYFEREGTTFTFGMRKEGVEQFTTASITSEYDLYLASNNTQIVATSQSLNNLISADLKEVSLTVDGMPVFSGNKTGIDTIKPDDYTVVGTPTISADGIASGFSSSNRITISNVPTFDKPFKVCFKVKTGDLSSSQSTFYSNGGDYYNAISVYGGTNPRFQATLKLSDSSTPTFPAVTGVQSFTEYTGFFSWTGTEYRLHIDGLTDWVYQSSLALSTASNTTVKLGCLYTDELPFNGSIDLNAFKIYVDGDLVYQPCLKIPYTESKTGSKIVDSIYRDRVNDMHNQFGYAPYFTIDKNSKDFTLPQGDIYGMMYKLIDQIVDAKLAELNQ